MEKMTPEEIKNRWGRKGFLNHTSLKSFRDQELPSNVFALVILTVICLASWYFIIKGLIWIVSQML